MQDISTPPTTALDLGGEDPSTDVPRPRWYALSGLLAAALALGISELVAAMFNAPSLILSIGENVIDLTPGAVERWAIETLGTNDKPALIVGIVVVSLLFGSVLGRIAERQMPIAIVGFIGFGVVGFAAGSSVPLSTTVGVFFASAAAVWAGIAGLSTLIRILTTPSASKQRSWSRSRRTFLIGSASVVALTAATAAVGRGIATRMTAALAGRADVVLPTTTDLAVPLAASHSLDVGGLSPFVTPNADFYRIDTALMVPTVDLDTWTLSISGAVDKPFSLTYNELLDLPMIERYVTIACVSNRVGGNLIGNAKWLGVPLSLLLKEADVQPAGTQIVGRSVDEFTVGFPTEAAFDGREALIAVGMNGEPLPFEHGFPARLVVSGLYGFVSATKWLSEIELTGWDDYDAYWIQRNWAKESPIKTHSRIDTPRNRSDVPVGPGHIAGVAWAQNTGIAKVEVRVNDGPWRDAELPDELTINTWRQWSIAHEFVVGENFIEVRATDASGYTQTAEIAPVSPDGATGYHTIKVSAEV